MDTTTAQPTVTSSVPGSSYVDAYQPPTAPLTTPPPPVVATTPPVTSTPDVVPTPVAAPVIPDAATPPVASQEQNISEELEDQNIFFMLGVTDGTPEQRESFLDELQQVIWEDFLEFDVKLLITKDEQTELNNLLNAQASSELEKQEKIVVFLEKLVPDLEEIMLEKALELKEEMARERVKGMREFYKDKPEDLQKIDSAEQMMNAGKWYSASVTLNGLK